eukprot:749314-Hanusia_phi.AAC.2
MPVLLRQRCHADIEAAGSAGGSTLLCPTSSTNPWVRVGALVALLSEAWWGDRRLKENPEDENASATCFWSTHAPSTIRGDLIERRGGNKRNGSSSEVEHILQTRVREHSG